MKTDILIRETKLLQLIALEYTMQQTANILDICFQTVNSHRKSMQHKLMVRNSEGLIRKAFDLGYLRINKQRLVSNRPHSESDSKELIIIPNRSYQIL